MFAALIVLNLAVLVGLAFMAWSPKYGLLRGSAVNPLIIFVVFSLFFNINFMVLHGRGTIGIFERATPVTSVDTLIGYINYTVLFIAAAAGMIVAQLVSPPRAAPRADASIESLQSKKTISALIYGTVLVIGALGAIRVLMNFQEILAGKVTRQSFFLDNPLLTVSLSLVSPGLAIFLSVRRPTSVAAIAATLLALPTLFVTGTRGVLIFIGIIFLVNLAGHGRRIQAYWYLALIPVTAYFLAILRFLLRRSNNFRSFGDYVAFEGGFGGLFFNTSEVAMAEAITVISNNLDQFSRPPFEGFIGVLMYPLPRSIFSFKPMGAGGIITEALSPARWEMTRSEILPTGYGDIIMQFGPWIGTVVVFIMAFTWLSAALRVIHLSAENRAIWLPFLIWWLYIFLRGAVFNLGASIWPFMIVLIGYRLLLRLRFISRPLPQEG